LPGAARPAALAFLGRLAGAAHGPSAAAQAELWRQLEAGARVGCDCGGGWRWSGRGEAVALCREAGATPRFTYTFTVPGRCDVPEIGCRVSLEPAALAPWMRRGDPRRAGLAALLPAGAVAEVRNRRPGDRVHPLGAPGERKLKDLLIDRCVPRADRDRLPLLCLGGRIAWVPGITVDERHRLPAEGPVWLAQLEEL
jgi:tRNA(Ile)-lysidine synthase